MPRLEVGSANRVDEAETHRSRPARVDLRELLLRELRRVALFELHASETDEKASQQEGRERMDRRLGKLHSEQAENLLQRDEAVVDVPVLEEQLGRASLELDRLRDLGSVDGAQEDERCLRSSSRVRRFAFRVSRSSPASLSSST